MKARELGERIVAAHPDSYAGHFLLGAAFQHGEGELPQAVFHLRRALALYEARWSPPNQESAPWNWHKLALGELAGALGSMERPDEQLDVIAEYNRFYEPRWEAHRIWPLMKLGRYDEARQAAQAAVAQGGAQRKAARADLCGAESEAGDRMQSWLTCVEATREFRAPTSRDGQLEFSNAAEASLSMLRYDEAERFLVEAGRRDNAVPWVNPYQQQADLYLVEGRVAEAIAAMRAGQELRVAQPAWSEQFYRAHFDGVLARLFLLAGVTDRAALAARRAVEQPDRQGHTSGSQAEYQAASLVLLATALGEQAERSAEEAVSAPFVESVKLRLRAWRQRVEAWRARRRAAVLLSDEAFLARSLRPYYIGVQLPAWLLPEVVDTVGGGVALAALARAREVETLSGASSFFDALAAEAYFQRGDCGPSDAAAASALHELPAAEVTLRARLDALVGECARRRGDDAAVEAHDAAALAHDPDVLRRLGLRLPVAIEGDGSGLARRAARLLARSPRFDSDGGGPFLVTIEGGRTPRACLRGGSREELACAHLNLPVDTPDEAGARLLVAEFHRAAFALKADLSQADLDTLDGSPSTQRADHRVRSLLDALGDRKD